ncbi:MAG: hypothetical protein LBI18_02835 [Planctomycetaceae bacterium]|jgi:hypothetical protein|nr:hypothetical protein [Planctomycetaceae bacterium]
MMKQLFFFFMIGSIIVSGCRQETQPADFPKLYSCKITITQDNVPVENVQISLCDNQISNKWSIGGTTNISGTAVIQTHGQFSGVPSGKFKVVLSKTESEDGTTVNESTRRKPETVRVYSLIDKKYLDESTTPLEINVENKSVTKKFEVGTPNRILIQTITPNDI